MPCALSRGFTHNGQAALDAAAELSLNVPVAGGPGRHGPGVRNWLTGTATKERLGPKPSGSRQAANEKCSHS